MFFFLTSLLILEYNRTGGYMFDRLELLIGDKIDILKNKTVLLIGLGGVGGHAFEVLVRSAIGTIIVADADKIDETNLNRQLLTNLNNIGKFKVDAAQKHQEMINPNCQIIKVPEFINAENIERLFDRHIDFVIDAIDTIATKKLIIKHCKKNNIKFISVMGMGNKMHPELLEITDIKNTSYDPLAKEIRKFVKEEKINGQVPVVFSKEKPIKTGKIGSNAFVPSAAGIFASSYVINELIKER